MSNFYSFTYPSSDAVHTIHACRWEPEGAVRGVVQLVHGLQDHIGRYAHVAQFLCDHGFVVVGEDHLGHGKTADDTSRGYFGPKNGWDWLVGDVRRLRELTGERYPGIPYIMFGHSMGSFLTRSYLIRYPGTLDGAIISGTGQEPALKVAFGKNLAALVCRLRGADYPSKLLTDMALGVYNKPFRPARTPSDWVCGDERVVDAFRSDPMCAFTPTCGLFRDMLGGVQFNGRGKNLAKMDKNTPVYFFSGAKDPVGGMSKGVEKVVRLFRRAGCRDVSLRIYPDGRHETFNEKNQGEVLADVLDWLESVVG